LHLLRLPLLLLLFFIIPQGSASAVAVVFPKPATEERVPHPSRGLHRAKGGNEYSQPTSLCPLPLFVLTSSF
jgi:hypothetical protein